MISGLLQGPLDRRQLLKIAAGALPGAVLTTSIGTPAMAARTSRAPWFDPMSPEDNLDTYIRMTRSRTRRRRR